MQDRSANDTGQVRRSIEVEYWVVDEDGHLTDAGSLTESSEGAEREFIKPMVEIKTTPCTSTTELSSELLDRIRTVVSEANSQGKKLVPLATPLHANDIEDFDSERTAIQDRVLGDDFEYVRHCAGTHIHIEQQPGNEIDQLNTLIALDPALALVNSSSYYQGEQLTSGARSTLYRRLAYQSLPNQGTLWPYAPDREEYARRIQRCYEEFLTQAMIAGVDRERAESTFTPEGAVWTPVQLRQEFSTVEWRSPDTALPSQVLQLASDIVSIVERAIEADVRIEGKTGGISDDAVVLPTFDSVQEYVDRATGEGLSPAVESYLERMGFDLSAYNPISLELPAEEPITEAAARELRLQYANRLEEDIAEGKKIPAT